AGVHRALRDHRRRPGERHRDRALPHLQVRLPLQRLRRRLRAQRDAPRAARRVLRRLPPPHPLLGGGHRMNSTRTLVSPAVLARPRGRAVYWTVFTGTVVLFALAFLFPVYWMATGAMKSPDEVARTPPTLVPENW